MDDSWQGLGELADPQALHGPVDVSNVEEGQAVHLLRQMVLIRTAERLLAEKRRLGLIGGPVHLGVGQEAVAAGVSENLAASDAVFGAHRSHSHLLALGSAPYLLFAEVLGKQTGASRGMGGSMHLWDESVGFYGSVPIVAGTVPLAVGAGLGLRMQERPGVAVAYLGDGAVEEGIVHESLNLAAVTKANVLFVVENNLFASHMHISLRQSGAATSRFAVANGIPFALVDGNDAVAVTEASRDLIAGVRSGNGPAFLEAVTYRWYGHVDWRDDIDVGVNRSQHDLLNWRARDPIARLESAMVAAGYWSQDQTSALINELEQSAQEAWAQAESDPYPPQSALLDRVYA